MRKSWKEQPITRSEQFPWARATAFSLTSIFLERLWRKLRIFVRFHKPVIKTKTPKNGIFDLLITFSFPLSFLIFIMRSRTERSFHFRGRKCSKMHLKINRSVKTQWHRTSMKVARSGLYTPGSVQCLDSRFHATRQQKHYLLPFPFGHIPTPKSPYLVWSPRVRFPFATQPTTSGDPTGKYPT